MNNDPWETIDWGDDAGDTSSHQTIPRPCANTKFSAATARLSGSSEGSEEHDKASGPSTPTTNATFPERKQQARKKRNSWFDVDWTKLVPLGDEQGEFRSSVRSQWKVSNIRAAHDSWRRHRRRQSDYAIEKRRVLERHALLEEQPLSRSVTKRFLSTVGLRKNSVASVSDDDDLDVPFPTNARRQSCN